MKSILLSLITVVILGTSSVAQKARELRYFLQATTSPASAIPYGANPKAGRYINVGDARIYYEVYGKGSPLVILHGGIVGSTYEMGQLIDSLSKHYQVIAVSARGHGKSEMGSQTPTYERKSADVNRIISSITKDSVTVLGFSDGAYTGYFLAALHPEKVKKLIAIGAGEWKQGFRTFNNSRQALFSMDSVYFEQQMELMPEPKKLDEWLGTLNQFYNSLTVGKETLSAIKCPVLVIAGELDQNAPLKTIIAAYEMIPKAQLSIIPNAPHPVFLVNFPAVWASISPFINNKSR
jgi:pimeloyl-ACP methyl ester carboxylesterase